jgi:hypothetical protein
LKVKHIQSIISARFLGGLQKDKSSGYLASIAIGYPQDYPLVRWIERPPRPASPGNYGSATERYVTGKAKG